MMAKVKLMSTDETTSKLTEWFNMMGWPRNIRSDGGPAFWKKFADWCESKGVKFDLSSAYHPQSNGSAEEGVKRCKSTMVKAMEEGQNIDSALAELKNTPMVDGPTLSTMFFRRRLR